MCPPLRHTSKHQIHQNINMVPHTEGGAKKDDVQQDRLSRLKKDHTDGAGGVALTSIQETLFPTVTAAGGILTQVSLSTPRKPAFLGVSDGSTDGQTLIVGSMSEEKLLQAITIARCKVCYRRLTGRRSVARSMGPVCARKVRSGVTGSQFTIWDLLKG